MCANLFRSCLTLCGPMDCNLPDSSVHGILQARILESAAISFSIYFQVGVHQFYILQFGSCYFNPSPIFFCYHLRNPFSSNEWSFTEITVHYVRAFDSLDACVLELRVGVPLQMLLIWAEFLSLSYTQHLPSDCLMMSILHLSSFSVFYFIGKRRYGWKFGCQEK